MTERKRARSESGGCLSGQEGSIPSHGVYMAQWQNWQMRRPAKADPLARDLGSGPSCVVEPVAEWFIAAVCKTVFHRFESGRALVEKGSQKRPPFHNAKNYCSSK